MNHESSLDNSEPKKFGRTRYAIGLFVLGAIVAYFLLNEHRAHFFGALPFLLLLACPLMHFFMHHGHGAHATGHAPHSGGKQGSHAPATTPATKTAE